MSDEPEEIEEVEEEEEFEIGLDPQQDNGALLSENTVFIVDVYEFAEEYNTNVIFCTGTQLFVLDKDSHVIREVETKKKQEAKVRSIKGDK